jgi:DNA repair protein SbcC/Rad50
VAIPFIADEANSLLHRVTRNRMRVYLETQRTVKSRDTLADALDIIIEDDMGRRSLESYSGGQRFLVSLAVRVALAKLQARQSRHIDTFICDEGFGALDKAALAEVVEAVRGIRADFGLVLLISHVESMRDIFPYRIEVTGGPWNSRATLMLVG